MSEKKDLINKMSLFTLVEYTCFILEENEEAKKLLDKCLIQLQKNEKAEKEEEILNSFDLEKEIQGFLKIKKNKGK